MRRWQRIRTPRKVLLAAMVALGLLSVGAAIGDAGLASHIIGDPLPAGQPVSSDNLNAFKDGLQSSENGATANSSASVAIAVNGWHLPGSTSDILAVALFQISDPAKDAAYLVANTSAAAQAAAASLCAGATASPPAVDVPLANVPNGHFVTCRPHDGRVVIGTTFARANIFGVLAAPTTVINKSSLIAATQRQYAAVPSTISNPASTSTTGVYVGVGVGLGAIVIMALVGFVLMRRQRLAAPVQVAVSASAGWYPDPTNAGHPRYWSGQAWGPLAPPPPPGWSPPPPPESTSPAGDLSRPADMERAGESTPRPADPPVEESDQ